MYLVENEIQYLDGFIRLNEEWILKYFELEDADFALAANPNQIINDGDYILSLVSENKVVGVCALFNNGDGVFKLARMALSPKVQGKGLGNKLICAALEKLTLIGANKVYLLSNTKLESAISLYKKHGFKTVSLEQHPIYSRANIVMD